jgi:flagellar biosynthesis protein FliR
VCAAFLVQIALGWLNRMIPSVYVLDSLQELVLGFGISSRSDECIY